MKEWEIILPLTVPPVKFKNLSLVVLIPISLADQYTKLPSSISLVSSLVTIGFSNPASPTLAVPELSTTNLPLFNPSYLVNSNPEYSPFANPDNAPSLNTM